MTLHPKAQAFLNEIAESDAPSWAEMPPEESRAIFNGFTDLFGTGPELADVSDLRTSGGIPLRCYRPTRDETLPAIVYFHGGGWVLGNIETHDAVCRRLADATGRVVVSVEYRLAPEHAYPAACDDCFDAVLWIAAQAEELKIDPGKIVVAGDSAGGNLAAAVAVRCREDQGPQLEAQVLIYPVIEPDFATESYEKYATDYMLTRESMQWFWQQYLPDPTQGAKFAALQTAAVHELPKCLVITAEYDVLRSEGERYAARLEEAGNSVSLKQYDGMLHGFVHFAGLFEDGVDAIREIADFLKAN